MSEEVKFTEEEIKQVKEIQDSYLKIQTDFGQTTIARIRLEEQLENLINVEDTARKNLSEIQTKEQDFLKEITKKYGEGSLNPETGVFTSNK